MHKIDRPEDDCPVLFADNASWHTSDDTRIAARALNLKIVFNLTYRPDLNPIELLFG